MQNSQCLQLQIGRKQNRLMLRDYHFETKGSESKTGNMRHFLSYSVFWSWLEGVHGLFLAQCVGTVLRGLCDAGDHTLGYCAQSLYLSLAPEYDL